jgi:hypothetical protein
MSHAPYLSVVGSLMYAMVFTRTYIAHEVGFLSRYMSKLVKECCRKIPLRTSEYPLGF